MIPTPQIKPARDSAYGLDIDCALRVHDHAGLDSLTCPRRQTQTFIGGVSRGSRANVCSDRLTIRAVVLAGGVAGGSSLGHIDSNRIVGDSSRRVVPDSIPQKVSIGGGNDKYRNSGWGVHCAVTYEEESNAAGRLTVRRYLAEQRGPGQITGVGETDLPPRCSRKVGSQSTTVGDEDEVRGNRRGNVRPRIGGRGPRRRNTIWVHGAAGRVRRLRPAPEDIDAVLSGDATCAKQQRGSPQEQHQQLSHRIFLLDCSKRPPSPRNSAPGASWGRADTRPSKDVAAAKLNGRLPP